MGSGIPQGGKRRLLAVVLALVGAVWMGSSASPASAYTYCEPRTLSQPFAYLGDYNSYFRAPNGGFETTDSTGTSTPEWFHWYGSRVYGGYQAPRRVAGAWDSRAGYVYAGAEMGSDWFCVGADEDSMRFFYMPSSSGASMNVTMWVSDGVDQISKTITVSSANGIYDGSGWYVSQRVLFPVLRDPDGYMWVSVRFRPTAGWFMVDDLMVDPWKTR